MRSIFFSKNKSTALSRLRNLAKNDNSLKFKTVKLAKKQIPNISNWQTFEVVNIKIPKRYIVMINIKLKEKGFKNVYNATPYQIRKALKGTVAQVGLTRIALLLNKIKNSK